MTTFIGFEQQGGDGFIIVNKDQIKTISESSGHYACVSLLDGSKLYSLQDVKFLLNSSSSVIVTFY